MIEIFTKKFPQIDPGFIIHSLVAFEEAEKDPDPICVIPISWNEVKSKLKEAVIDYTINYFTFQKKWGKTKPSFFKEGFQNLILNELF